MFVNALNHMVGHRLAGDRKSMMKEAKIELNIKEYIELGHSEMD